MAFLEGGYPFTSHVIQHFLLALVVPPVVILAAPRKLSARVPNPNPLASWIIGVGATISWHITMLFHAAIMHSALHIAYQVSFLIIGLIFWWPVLQPIESLRLKPLVAIAYLFSACSACSLMGAALTFGPAVIDSKADQQLGGLIMWVPGCFVYLSAILFTAYRWYAAPEQVENENSTSTLA